MPRQKEKMPETITITALKLKEVADVDNLSYQQAMRRRSHFAVIRIPYGSKVLKRYLPIHITEILRKGGYHGGGE